VRLVLVLATALWARPSGADRLWCGTPWVESPRPTIAHEERVEPERRVEIRGIRDPIVERTLRRAVLACGQTGKLHVRIAITTEGVAYALDEPCLDAQLRSSRMPRAREARIFDAIVDGIARP
jgi:hypothetical protein